MTPLRRITNQIEFTRHRRMIGLFALFYATTHLLVWLMFVLEFRWFAIADEILERPYITVGFISLFDSTRTRYYLAEIYGEEAR